MLTTLALSLALAAPVPAAAAPNPIGPVPRLVEVHGGGGKATIPVARGGAAAVGNVVINGNPNGGQLVLQNAPREAVPVELTEVKDLKVYTVDGKEVTVADAAKRLSAGGTVVVSADGKKVDPRHLKLFRDEVLVLVSPELATTAAAGPANGGIQLQFQVQPGQIQIVPPPAGN